MWHTSYLSLVYLSENPNSDVRILGDPLRRPGSISGDFCGIVQPRVIMAGIAAANWKAHQIGPKSPTTKLSHPHSLADWTCIRWLTLRLRKAGGLIDWLGLDGTGLEGDFIRGYGQEAFAEKVGLHRWERREDMLLIWTLSCVSTSVQFALLLLPC